MIRFLISASDCPKCGKGTYWEGLGFDYDTYEKISWCDSCGYEKREFDQKAKETFELLEKAVKEGQVKNITVSTKPPQEES